VRFRKAALLSSVVWLAATRSVFPSEAFSLLYCVCNADSSIRHHHQVSFIHFSPPLPLIPSGLMKDVYLCRRLEDPELSRNIVSHYKRTPTLETLCRQPFVCWLAATTFQRCYRYQGYGAHPPRLTPFYVHVMVIQTNRKLQRYRGQAENHLVRGRSVMSLKPAKEQPVFQ